MSKGLPGIAGLIQQLEQGVPEDQQEAKALRVVYFGVNYEASVYGEITGDSIHTGLPCGTIDGAIQRLDIMLTGLGFGVSQ